MVKLIVDSAADIAQKEADELGVVLIPIEVRFQDEEYLDGVTLLPENFYPKLQAATELPKTSQINPYRFEEEFKKQTENGDEVVAIIMSSKLSGTYLNAKNVAEDFKGKVFVVDSLNACIGERLLVHYALRLIKEGLSAKEVYEKLEVAKYKINLVASIDTLKYLKMGGRISTAAAVAGELFSIKPIISVEDGALRVLGKAMGAKKAVAMVTSIASKKQIDYDMPFGIIWSGNDRSAAEKYLQDDKVLWGEHKNEVGLYAMGSTIGTHIGPGAVGVAFFEK